MQCEDVCSLHLTPNGPEIGGVLQNGQCLLHGLGFLNLSALSANSPKLGLSADGSTVLLQTGGC